MGDPFDLFLSLSPTLDKVFLNQIYNINSCDKNKTTVRLKKEAQYFQNLWFPFIRITPVILF